MERGSKLKREDVQKALAEAFRNNNKKFMVRPIPKATAKGSRKKTA